MKTLYTVLKTALYSFLGVFIGNTIYRYWDYRTHPGLYDLTAETWYTGTLQYGIFVIITVIILLAALIFLKKKMK